MVNSQTGRPTLKLGRECENEIQTGRQGQNTAKLVSLMKFLRSAVQFALLQKLGSVVEEHNELLSQSRFKERVGAWLHWYWTSWQDGRNVNVIIIVFLSKGSQDDSLAEMKQNLVEEMGKRTRKRQDWRTCKGKLLTCEEGKRMGHWPLRPTPFCWKSTL